uniref:Leucine-rich repeat-containing N-terminal plant-type domain-containing protein n=1 Tax=Nelumbo nucifera TaxID=4432 RepID=A0A822Z9E1_NELNU|nr:TPA_asm: hypothetical protein HUJ06_001134 [Nelumbo nucifera]
MVRSRDRSQLFLILLSAMIFASTSIEDDVKCLAGVKNSLSDPQGKLSSWIFSNNSVGFLCKFVGISCWNERENRLIRLDLPTMNLAGLIPHSLQYCQSLQGLDLSESLGFQSFLFISSSSFLFPVAKTGTLSIFFFFTKLKELSWLPIKKRPLLLTAKKIVVMAAKSMLQSGN